MARSEEVAGPLGLTGQQIWSFVNSLVPQQAAWLLLVSSGMATMLLMQQMWVVKS
jgi:hypothetical protein